MPPLRPKFRHRRREIRSAKVFHQVDPEDLRRADRHVGIAREVAVELKREEVGRQDQVRRGAEGGQPVCAIDEGGQPVGDDHLLEQTPEHQLQALGHAARAERHRLTELRQERLRALDRSG